MRVFKDIVSIHKEGNKRRDHIAKEMGCEDLTSFLKNLMPKTILLPSASLKISKTISEVFERCDSLCLEFAVKITFSRSKMKFKACIGTMTNAQFLFTSIIVVVAQTVM